MKRQRRKLWSLSLFALLFASLMSGAPSFAAKGGGGKPPKDDPPPEALGGTVFARVNNQAYGMKTDGSGVFAALPDGFWGTPSHRKYGVSNDLHRWWLSVEYMGPGQYIALDGTTRAGDRQELFAFRADAAAPGGVGMVQITDFYPYIKLGVSARPEWSNDGQDSFVSFKTISADSYGPVVSGIHAIDRIEISAAVIEAAYQANQDLLITPNDTAVFQAATTSGLFEANYKLHHWSPGGDQVAYGFVPASNAPTDVYLTDLITNQSGLLTTLNTSSGPKGLRWSPSGNTITFGDLYDIRSVSPSGTGQATILDGSLSEQYDAPFWSPDSQHLVCRRYRYVKKGGGQWRHEITVTTAAGSQLVDIPADFDPLAYKEILGWVSDTVAP